MWITGASLRQQMEHGSFMEEIFPRVIDKLDYLSKLGIEVIYFNPILFRLLITSMILRTMTL